MSQLTDQNSSDGLLLPLALTSRYRLPAISVYRKPAACSNYSAPQHFKAALSLPSVIPPIDKGTLFHHQFTPIRLDKMEHSPVRLSPVKDGRRVLGEKTPNASILSPSKNHKADTAATTVVPMKPLREALSPRVTGLSHYAGQKRTIDHVEEQTENPSSQQSLSAALPPYEEQFHIFDESSQSTVKSATMVCV